MNVIIPVAIFGAALALVGLILVYRESRVARAELEDSVKKNIDFITLRPELSSSANVAGPQQSTTQSPEPVIHTELRDSRPCTTLALRRKYS
jgi:hypothetical protein